MRKFISLVLCVLLLATLIAGCSSDTTTTTSGEQNQTTEPGETSGSGSDEDVTIVWFTEQQDDAELALNMKYRVEPFQDAFPNIKIEVAPTADYDQVLKIQLASGGGPDLLNIGGPSSTMPYVAGDKLVDLTDMVQESGLEDIIFDWALDSCYINDRLYSIPNSYEALLLWYNMDMFAEKGWEVPTNYEELEVICNEAQELGLTPISFGTSNFKAINEQFVSVALANFAGRDNVKKALEGDLDWTDPLIVDSIATLNDMWQKGWINDKKSHAITSDDGYALFYSQQAPMTMTGTWMITGFMTQITDFEYDAAVFPSLREGVPPTVPLGAGGVFAINAASEYQEECFEVIKFWFENVDLHAQSVAEGLQPFPRDIPESAFPAEFDPTNKGIFNLLEDAQADMSSAGHVMWTYWPAETRVYMMDNIEKVYLGSLTVEEYLEESQRLFQKELEAGNLPVVP